MTETLVKFLGGMVVGYIITSLIESHVAYQTTTVTPYGGGTVGQAVTPAPYAAAISGFTPTLGSTTVPVAGMTLPSAMNYDEAHVVPCTLGTC